MNYHDWHYGKKLVCIYGGDWGHARHGSFSVPTRVPMLNEILTLKEIRPHRHDPNASFSTGKEGELYCTFLEIPEVQVDGPLRTTVSWHVRNFRPLDERKTDISIFTPLLTDRRVKEDA